MIHYNFQSSGSHVTRSDVKSQANRKTEAQRRSCVCVCVRTGDQSEALDAGEVGVLDGHDTSLGKQLLWIVIDQLSVKKERNKRS